ncbi:Hydrogen cyanide synthase subunit HcnC precursor [Roseovarius litorisediminis]|uniref:Hydrogen cyanide synthase subunit HcnC n=1 Tax=Roseovarius litorisediminis TaxID=1312363 RepID=A0A1Y5TKX5_9RHOB|nr:FAD-binding oxidoreductase [Roseovarius litorisediminis]SLN66590.1 Hydrogen cyanide synthase subunit HcnC precursor [Roseovarius litorisediminis]
MSTSPDIIVIGGGIAGISAAAALAQDARVTVLESEPQLGYHSTGRSAAIFIRNYGNATLRALNAAAYPALAGDLLGESVLSVRGELLVVQEHELDSLADYLKGASDVDQLTADEAHALVPVLRREKIAAAVIERDAQDIDVDRLLQGCNRLLRDRGGTVLTGQPVTDIQQNGTGWRVTTRDNDFTTGIIVNAAGAWADHVAAMADVPGVNLQPMRRSAVLMAVPDDVGPVRDWPLFGSVSEGGQGWYAKPDGNRLMISPADEDPVDPQDAWPDDMVLAEGLYRFEQMVDVPIVKPSHSWAGLRSFAPDRTPVVGFDPAAHGFFWLAGQGGYGVQTSPALAALTRAICTGAQDDLTEKMAASLSPNRFR